MAQSGRQGRLVEIARYASFAKMKRKQAPSASASLFPPRRPAAQPLADRMRPAALEEVVGQDHLLGPGKLLSEMVAARRLHSIILWGPPGTGKTTIALLLARHVDADFVPISAVTSGVADLRAAVEQARRELETRNRRTVVFIDEIHRWNRAQQDAFLPHVESGLVTLIGATTENPSFEVVAPLLSRVRVLVLNPLSDDAITALVKRALDDPERGLGKLEMRIGADALAELVRLASSDARRALNTLEIAAELAQHADSKEIQIAHVSEAAQHKALLYDRAGEEHYNVISAFIKSMRGSDPDAAMYWMMRMVEAGEDPLFIARRMVIFASEDIGNADPRAIQIAIGVKDAVDFVGLPEGVIPLAQGVTYLSCAPKSNASYRAMLQAREDVRTHGPEPVPLHLRNAPTPLMKELGYSRGYKYPHDSAGGVVEQDFMPDRLLGREYYHPSERGFEARLREYLDRVRHIRNQARAGARKKDPQE